VDHLSLSKNIVLYWTRSLNTHSPSKGLRHHYRFIKFLPIDKNYTLQPCSFSLQYLSNIENNAIFLSLNYVQKYFLRSNSSVMPLLARNRKYRQTKQNRHKFWRSTAMQMNILRLFELSTPEFIWYLQTIKEMISFWKLRVYQWN